MVSGFRIWNILKLYKEKIMAVKLPKMTLKGVQFRKLKLDITADVLVGDEVVEEYPVGWVLLRGQQDPVFLKKYTPHLREYQDLLADVQEKIKSDPTNEEFVGDQTKLLDEATQKLLIQTVTCAIEEWDEEFFGTEFSQENAFECFSDEDNNPIYNQIALAVRNRESFLPVVSVQPSNG